MGFFNILGPLHKLIGGGLVIALALTAAWAWRVDTLRGEYKARIVDATDVLNSALSYPKPIRPDQLLAAIVELRDDRDHHKDENLKAGRQLTKQSARIIELNKEGEYLKMLSGANREAARLVVAERNKWIELAENAGSRTERLAAELELTKCEDALNALYNSDF